MIHYKVFQNEEDWATFRGGLFTASEIHRLLSEPKNKKELLSVGAKTYVMERVSAILAPSEPNYYNSAMEHGNQTEPQAVLRIAKELNKTVDDDDFIYTSIGGYVFFFDDEYDLGGTPDVIIKDLDMCCEVKCPMSKTHLEYLLIKTQEDVKKSLGKYYAQMQLNIYLTNTKKCLFVSFDDRFYNEKNHYHSIEILRDEPYIENLLSKAKIAKEEKENIMKQFKN